MGRVSDQGDRLLTVVAEHFCTYSAWPEADELQRALILADDTENLVVWDALTHVPPGLIRRESTGDGRELLVLTAHGLESSGRAGAELAGFVTLVKVFVDAWKERRAEVTSEDLAAALGGLSDTACRALVVLETEGLVAHVTRRSEDGTVWTPNRNAVFRFRNVSSIQEYVETVAAVMNQPPALAPTDPDDLPANDSGSEELVELETNLGATAKKGFILMPFDDGLDWLHRTIRFAGTREGALMKRADDIFSPGVVLDQILSAVDDADVVVSVCTGRNANVFFEMGYAWRDHKVILVAEDAADLPFDVQHYRTVLYGRSKPGENLAGLAERLQRAIASVLAEERLPRGRRLENPPAVRQVARLNARLESHGNNRDRFVLINTGTVPVNDVDVSLPPEARSLHLIREGLPLPTLRPGQSVPLLASCVMGGGKPIFDVTLTGVTDDGTPVEDVVTISLYT